jgi:hypothetical protein
LKTAVGKKSGGKSFGLPFEPYRLVALMMAARECMF